MQTLRRIFSFPFIQRVVRYGWILLAVNCLWTFTWTLRYTWGYIQQPSERLSLGLEAIHMSPGEYFALNAGELLLVFSAFFIVSVLLFIRMPEDRMALFSAVFLMAFGTAYAYPVAPEFLIVWSSNHWFYIIPFMFANVLAWPLLMIFFAIYPTGSFVPSWMRWVSLYCVVFSMIWAFFPKAFGAPSGWLSIFVLISIFIIFGGILYAQVYRYRFHATQPQRQQTKWMVFAVLIIVAKQIFVDVMASLANPAPGAGMRLEIASILLELTFILVPLAVGIAIFRYRLWDIDLLIRRTLLYFMLTGLLALVYLGSVVVLQSLLRSLTGQGSSLAVVVSTLGIAALFNPTRRRLQDLIDRRFYRQKYDADQALASFARTARQEVELEALTGELLGVVQKTVQPERLSIWLPRHRGMIE
jgi:hypothetical protein